MRATLDGLREGSTGQLTQASAVAPAVAKLGSPPAEEGRHRRPTATASGIAGRPHLFDRPGTPCAGETTMPNPVIDIHLAPDELTAALRDDVATGLTSSPKELPPKWFYDDRGSALFDEITRLDEYYPTRAEREILARRAAEIAASAPTRSSSSAQGPPRRPASCSTP